MDMNAKIKAINEFNKTLKPTKIETTNSSITLEYKYEKHHLIMRLLDNEVTITNFDDNSVYILYYISNWIDKIQDILNDFIFETKEEHSN
jgi:hypothetical protein